MSSQRRVQRTRNEILDRAWSLISEQGAEVSLGEIAKAAGVSRQSVYDHFGSRGGLILALVRRADERLDIKNSLFTAFDLQDPEERLRVTIDVWICFVREIYPVASDLIRLRKTDEDASAAWEDRMSDLRAWLKVLTSSLENDRALQPVWSAQTASEFLWASFSVQVWGLLTEDCRWSTQDASSVLKRTLCQTLLRAGG
ncbi:TetR/AcrR family transcriptional regulator [Roseibium aggregatum]|uniref:TetR/AcrR family transcriptional regulator n=1 Tax=Roseibium aggregatum TaxID=187304 RepID=A0A939ECY1_9HYPH|nr:TetR/AcrR family transcriptional regulator [Roseibium aggregatum]MBN9670907.1 TetR/AcrR family transcriptional regulator [Roseibium aggregatum]